MKLFIVLSGHVFAFLSISGFDTGQMCERVWKEALSLHNR